MSLIIKQYSGLLPSLPVWTSFRGVGHTSATDFSSTLERKYLLQLVIVSFVGHVDSVVAEGDDGQRNDPSHEAHAVDIDEADVGIAQSVHSTRGQ